MKKILAVLAISISVITLTAFSFSKSSLEDKISYPDGYRYWVHIKTGLIGPQNPAFQTTGGYHHIYANTKAMQGYTTGKFPEGSIIVFDVLNAKEQNGNTREDTRNHIDVMVKDSLQFASTGGWGYEEFKGDSHTETTLSQAAKTQCYNCHAKNNDHVFSEFRK